MTTEETYPYFSGNNGTTGACEYNPTVMPKAVSLMGHATLPFNDQFALEEALVTRGPVAISAYASKWKDYESGIFKGCDYSENISVNHAIQLVGYTEDAYIVRNSWSAEWGEDGYIRFPRERVAHCGIDSTPLNGAACVNDGQVTQVVCGMCGIFSNSAIPIGAKVN